MFSSLSYWYHLSYADICAMPHSAIEAYIKNIDKNHAELRMMLGEATRLPHLSPEYIEEWADDLNSKLNNGKPRKPVIAPLAVLKIIGIGIRK